MIEAVHEKQPDFDNQNRTNYRYLYLRASQKGESIFYRIQTTRSALMDPFVIILGPSKNSPIIMD